MVYSLCRRPGGRTRPAANQGGVPQVVGIELFTQYILPFEMVGVLLLVALIGALLLGRDGANKAFVDRPCSRHSSRNRLDQRPTPAMGIARSVIPTSYYLILGAAHLL